VRGRDCYNSAGVDETPIRPRAVNPTGGDADPGELLPLVYEELRRLAAQRLANERPGQTLQATALVHEAYLRLLGPEAVGAAFHDRAHFFGAAAEAMRRILIERARRTGRLRHGGGRRRVDFDALQSAQLEWADPDEGSAADLLSLDDALTRLEAEDPAAASVVKLRYFAGLTIDEAANNLGISVRTANRHWAFAKAWLYEQLADADGVGG
jgi:RNA polymerase sigma factor (TIGR02999 family)